MATVKPALSSQPSSSSSSSSLPEPPGGSRGSMGFDAEVVEESIEFEEEEEAHLLSMDTLHNSVRIRHPRTADRSIRRATRTPIHTPSSCPHSTVASSSGNLSSGSNMMCAASIITHERLSGRGHGEKAHEVQQTERYDLGLFVKGVNPSRGLAKLPDSPVHCKSSLPTRLALAPASDGEDWRTDDSQSQPGSALPQEHEMAAPWLQQVRVDFSSCEGESSLGTGTLSWTS